MTKIYLASFLISLTTTLVVLIGYTLLTNVAPAASPVASTDSEVTTETTEPTAIGSVPEETTSAEPVESSPELPAEEEIELVFDGDIQQRISARVSPEDERPVAPENIVQYENLQTRLSSALDEALDYEVFGEPVPAELLEEIARIDAEIEALYIAE